ncbi:MAG: pre-peptidase C-terminal domain-containing protein, partial [Blastocatellia bacterium]
LTLPATGLYTILVRDFNLNRAGNYAVNLQFTTGRCGTSISCGQTLSRNIDSIARQDTYTFNGNAGEAVNVGAVAVSGVLAARAEIYSPSNTLIGANGFGNTNTGSLTLPATGTYTILVRDFNLNRTGPYAINLQFTTGRCGTAIACGETKTGRNIASIAQQDSYTFSANAGEAVNIAAVATSGELAARLELYSPANTLIGANGFGNTNTGSLRLPATGVYTILVRDFNLNRTGVYAINLQFMTGRCGAPISGGQTLSGSINSAAEQDSFAFFGREGGSINISAVATSGMLAARAEVYNPSGVLIGANGFGNTSTGNLMMTVTGIHTILIRDFNLNKTGEYNVNLTCLGNACAPSVTLSLSPDPLTITAGSNGNMTATIGVAQSTATTVTLSSSNTTVATVPSSVTIPANATSASFAVTGVAAGTATITATLPPSLGGTATASVMVREQTCLPNSVLPSGFRPFSRIYYITGPNAGGDRLVVGIMPPEQRQILNAVPLPNQFNQRFCDPVELAPGLLAIAYVPTPNERNGDFISFAGLLLDPVSNMPFPNGLIPANRLGDPHAWRIVNQVGGPALVSAASYSAVALASESIAAIFGARLATGTRVATSLPLPTILEGSTVKVRDSSGVTRDAPLFFVSPDQINFQVPPGTANGIATVTIMSGNGSVSIGTMQIVTVAPGLFAANATGRDVAAGVALRVKTDGTQVFEPIARFDQAQGRFAPVPIDLGPETDQVFLILYGTGFRFRSSLGAAAVKIGGVDQQVLYAGEAPGFIGLDQLNVRLSRSLIGRGEVDVSLTVDGKTANMVRAHIR